MGDLLDKRLVFVMGKGGVGRSTIAAALGLTGARRGRRTGGASRYDLVIVDAPATGHGVAMIRTPKQFADIARVGPIAHQGRIIHRFVSDRRKTGVVAVALPQEMPVNETVLLRDELADAGLRIDRVVA